MTPRAADRPVSRRRQSQAETGIEHGGHGDVTDRSGEKRWVASLMVDLVGSTGMTEELGPERAFDLIREVLQTAVGIVEAHGGHFIEYAGDSVFALFGAPVAVENATLSAGNAALGILDRLTARKPGLIASFGIEPKVRIGLAAGEVLVSELQFSGQSRVNALGSAVNLAARLQAVATPDEVWCSEAVARELTGLAEIEDRGAFRLKGFDAPQRLFRIHRVRGTGDSLDIRMARSSGVFVGRAGPLARLARWMRGESGAGGALWVSGPAGIGKSRLVKQAGTHLPEGPVLQFGKCRAAEKGTPLRPLLGLLREAARADGAAGAEALGAWLRGLTGTHDPALVRLMLGAPAPGADAADDGADALRIRRDIARALRELGCDPARRLVIEDMHWMDPVSREVLREVLDDPPPGLRLLVTSRDTPDLPGPWEALPVAPLTEDDLARMLEAAHPGIPEKAAIARELYRQSEGNPLFAEELMRHAGAEGMAGLSALRGGAGIGVIQNLIFSRFDTLPAADKAVLRQAAILGREVAPAALDLIGIEGTTRDDVLMRAAAMHLIDPAQHGQPLRFAHVLFQNVIRDTITEAEATGLHRRAGDILLAAAETGGVEPPAPDLAHHFDRARDWPRAALYNVRAAQAAWRVYALDVCVDHLDRAEAALDKAGSSAMSDDLFADFVMTFCRVLDVAGHWTRLRAVVARHLPRLERMPGTRACLVARMLHAKALNQGGCSGEAQDAIETTLALAKGAGDDNALAMARCVHMDIANDSPLAAQRDRLPALFEITRDYALSGADPHMAQMRLYEMSAYWRQEGDVPRARALAEEILAYGRDHDDSRARAFGGWILASITAMIEEYEATRSAAAEAMRNALPGTMDHITAQVFHAGATLMLGRPAMTAQELQAVSEIRLRAGDATMAIIAVFYAAGSLFSQGRIREALAALEHTDGLVRAGCEYGLRQQYLIKRGESFLTVAGLLPGPLPQPRLPLREVPAALGLRLRARRLAAEAYDALERDFDGGHGIHRARVDLGRGLLAGRKGRARLLRARDVFREQSAAALVDLAQQVL
jgi:class 3 adenylate cyclase